METRSSTLIAIEPKNGGICLTENRQNGADADYRLDAEDSCRYPWFQDITPIFELFLSGRGDMAFVFPPGSGKSTVAEMFARYAHYEGDVTGYDSFFNNCTFKKQNEELYHKFYRQCAVIRIDFKEVNIGDTLSSYRSVMNEIMGDLWTEYSFDEFFETEKDKLRKSDERYRTSLVDLCLGMPKENVFLLLDSLDCIYNQVAKIQPKVEKNLFKDFTSMIYVPQGKDVGLTHICFGVSPYYFTEYLQMGTCTFSIFPRSGVIDEDDTEEIARWNLDNNLALQTFSYGEDSIRTTCERINKMCEEYESMNRIENVDDMIKTCKKIGSYRVNDIELLNPYLVISYLWSFTKKRNYRFDIAPKSLWFESIHTKADCEMLRELLHTQETKKTFDMFPSFKIINTDRKHFLPLHVYGAYLSVMSTSDCESTRATGEKCYSLQVANDSAKIILQYFLDDLRRQPCNIDRSPSKNVSDALLNENYDDLCRKLSQLVGILPATTTPNEESYQAIIGGALSSCLWDGWSVKFGYPSTENPNFVISKRLRKYGVNEQITLVGVFKVLPPSIDYPTFESFEEHMETFENDYEAAKAFVKNLRTNVNEAFVWEHLKLELEQALKKTDTYAGIACQHFNSARAKVFIIVFHFNHVLLLHRYYVPVNAKIPASDDEKTWKIHVTQRFPVNVESIKNFLETPLCVEEIYEDEDQISAEELDSNEDQERRRKRIRKH